MGEGVGGGGQLNLSSIFFIEGNSGTGMNSLTRKG